MSALNKSKLLKTAGVIGGGIAAAIIIRRVLRPVESFEGQCVVITGGARGLGLEMARVWLAQGARVAICSRTPEEVESAINELRRNGGEVYGEACDVTDRSQVTSFLQRVSEEFGPVDVLVNNAGIIQVGPMECMTLEDYRRALETHFWGPLFAVEAVLPAMRARGRGRIVNISSIGGKISVPHLLPYCASKFALAGLSEGLRTELAPAGVTVTTVCPGLMRTGSPRNAEFKGRHRAEYAWFSIGGSLPGVTISSRKAARRIMEACRRGDAEVALSAPATLAMRVNGLMPGLGLSVARIINHWLPRGDGSQTDSRKGWQSFSWWSPSWLTTLNERAAVRNHENLSAMIQGEETESDRLRSASRPGFDEGNASTQ